MDIDEICYETDLIKEREFDKLLNAIGMNTYKYIGRIFPFVPDMYHYSQYVILINAALAY